MDDEQQQPVPLPPTPEPARKDPYAEPPVKDFSHLTRPPASPTQHSKRRHRWLWPLLLLVVVVLLGTGSYWYTHKTSTQTALPPRATSKSATTSTSPATIVTTNYTSSGFGVSLSYPKTWALSDNGTTSLSITSPAMTLTAASGQSFQGKIIFLMQPQGQIPSAYGSSNAVAVLPSQLVSYANPSSSQRAQTYISFVQYASAAVKGELDAIYITGNYGYQQDQVVPESDLMNLNPLVTVSFGKCSGSNCSALSDANVASSSWKAPDFSLPILTIVKSLSFS